MKPGSCSGRCFTFGRETGTPVWAVTAVRVVYNEHEAALNDEAAPLLKAAAFHPLMKPEFAAGSNVIMEFANTQVTSC